MALLTLFRIDENTGAVLHPEAVKLTKHVSKLTPKELAFLVDWVDYKGSFWQFPKDDDRKRKSWNKWYGHGEPKITAKIESARDEYNAMQYNLDEHILRSYREKVEMLINELINESSTTVMSSIEKAITSFQKRISEMETKIREFEDKLELEGGGELSYLERWQSNMKRIHTEKSQREFNEEKNNLTAAEETF